MTTSEVSEDCECRQVGKYEDEGPVFKTTTSSVFLPSLNTESPINDLSAVCQGNSLYIDQS